MARYTEEILREAAQNSTSVAGVVRYLGLKAAGGTHSHVSKRLKDLRINTTHFHRGPHNKGKTSPTKKTAADILIRLPEGSNRPKVVQLRRAMLEVGVAQICVCGISDDWQGRPLQLEVDHIDGDWYNNLIENLRFLCPNCHSQEPTNRSWRKS